MNSNQLLAHPEQSLVKHLLGVARRAKGFAARFQGDTHAELAGLLHDLGKAENAFQDRIAGKKDAEKHPHAHHGAALALEHKLWPVAFAVNGHHAGLHDRSALQQVLSKWGSSARKCEELLKEDVEWPAKTWPITDFGKTLPLWLETLSFAATPGRDAKMRAVDFYARMLFSVLVDADRLDTEEANLAEGSQANLLKRKTWRFGPKCLAAEGAADSLRRMLEAAIKERIAAAQAKNASSVVLDVRANVFAACEEKASADRGVFTLAVPTGGGKTLASMAFALQHIHHQNRKLNEMDPRRLRRIIIVIPYLNIIQQTTRELQMVFGDLVWAIDAVDPVSGETTRHPTKDEDGAWLENTDPNHRTLILEHHSQATDPKTEEGKQARKDHDSDGYDKERPLRQLAAENWDAPIIVTTTVQFFESLFSRRPADVRKLHNICQSVTSFRETPQKNTFTILNALNIAASPKMHPCECWTTRFWSRPCVPRRAGKPLRS